MEDSIILIEWRELYDGWLAKYNRKTGEFTWRIHHVVDRMSKQEKERYKTAFLNGIKHKSNDE